MEEEKSRNSEEKDLILGTYIWIVLKCHYIKVTECLCVNVCPVGSRYLLKRYGVPKL